VKLSEAPPSFPSGRFYFACRPKLRHSDRQLVFRRDLATGEIRSGDDGIERLARYVTRFALSKKLLSMKDAVAQLHEQ